MDIKAILFDKDGTLFHFNDTWGPWFYDILSELSEGNKKKLNQLSILLKYDLENKVFKIDSPFIAGTEGETISKIVSLFPELKEKDLVEWLSIRSRDVLGKPINNLHSTLSQIKKMNITMGIATNDTEASALHQLEKNNIKQFFKFIYGSDSGYGFKPNTGMQEEFLRVTNLHPKNVMMVGDSIADIMSGNNIGMISIGVLTGPLKREHLEKNANFVLDSISDLPKLIKKFMN
jgi:phosphoglycolate phosphatase